MMWAMRRQYSGDVTYCWPVSCWPLPTSQRRNSALSRPSLWRVARPVTSACALVCFQLAKVGGWSGFLICSMKAVGSIGAKSPERFRLLVITPVMPAPTSSSVGAPPTKFGIAIGIGLNSPDSTCIRPCARTDRTPTAANADPAVTMNRRRVTNGILLISVLAYWFVVCVHTQSIFMSKNIGMYFQVAYCSFGKNEYG